MYLYCFKLLNIHKKKFNNSNNNRILCVVNKQVFTKVIIERLDNNNIIKYLYECAVTENSLCYKVFD